MKTPNFTDPQFVDAAGTGGLVAAFGAVSGSFASVGSGVFAGPGLLSPETMGVAFSGMVATVALALPWGLVTSGGTVVHAHGTQTGQDTQVYTANFASLVPASGSTTAYLAATVTQIQQNPFPIPGPPPGHPSYNPSYVPTVGYATSVYSVALSAVSGGIDNVNSFELFRTTLTAGQVSISSFSTSHNVRAPVALARPGLSLASGGTLTPAQAQYTISPGASGLTHTLPSTSTAAGLTFNLVNPTNVSWTVAVGPGDSLVGCSSPSSSQSSVTIPPNSSLCVWTNGQGSWVQIGASAMQSFPSVTGFTSAGTFFWTVPAGVYSIDVEAVGGGGAGGGAPATGAGQVSAAAGGNSGCYGRGLYAVTPGQTLTVTVGAGGTAVTGGRGGDGGTSKITGTSDLLVCPGGAGGNPPNTYTAPLVAAPSFAAARASGGHINGAEGPGQMSLALATSPATALNAGVGANGPWGGGGFGYSIGFAPGAGGGGAANGQSAPAQAGGDGAVGAVLVYY